MTDLRKSYRKMLSDLAEQVSKGRVMLLKMGLFQAYASLRDHKNPLGNVEPKHIQKNALTTAEANGLSIGFWLTKSVEAEVDPRTVVADTSRLVEEVINLVPQPRAYACARGCHFCCREAVTVSEIEASALARHVEAMPDEERATIVSKLQNYAEGVRAVGPDRMRLNRVPCAFLDTASGACTVYDIRPFMCRSLTSYDVAPCKTDTELYQLDHIRYGAYTGALIGAMHADMPDHFTVMKMPREQQTRSGENLAIGVLRQLKRSSDKA